jgi:hypothetical protein
MLRLALALAALAACSFKPQIGDGDGGPSSDGGGPSDGPIIEIDGMIEDAPAFVCSDFVPRANPQHVEPCDALPGGAWVVSQYSIYDTTNGTYTGGDDPTHYDIGGVRVISVSAFAINANSTLRVVGNKPLLILSWSTIQIAGTLDVSSQRGFFSFRGPGANASACLAATDGENSPDSGGGGGGGFGGPGGNGGDGKNGNQNNEGGTGGNSVSAPTVVRGGCPGGDGGSGQDRGDGGDGGGAVQLTAKDGITITGRLHAGGAAGTGGGDDQANTGGGGGGGGSGGYIGLDAPTLELMSSILAANGGGGGTGCEINRGPDGENGQLTDAAEGGGAARCTSPAPGGDGSFGGTMNGSEGQSSNDSAGGGGGGAGFILTWGSVASSPASASPAISQR